MSNTTQALNMTVDFMSFVATKDLLLALSHKVWASIIENQNMFEKSVISIRFLTNQMSFKKIIISFCYFWV